MHNRGYNIVVVRDATQASETPETKTGEWARKVSLNMVEWYMGSTITVGDIKKGLSTQNKFGLSQPFAPLAYSQKHFQSSSK